MRARIRASVSPRQSESAAIRASISREAESTPVLSFAPLFFMAVVAFCMIAVAIASNVCFVAKSGHVDSMIVALCQ
jgi:hypothetical protein